MRFRVVVCDACLRVCRVDPRAALLSPAERRGGRSPPNQPGTRPHAIGMRCVLAGGLGWHFGGRQKPSDRRARRFRAGAMAAVHGSSSARAHRTAKPLRPATETIKTVLSRYSRRRHALRYGHFAARARPYGKAFEPGLEIDPPKSTDSSRARVPKRSRPRLGRASRHLQPEAACRGRGPLERPRRATPSTPAAAKPIK